MNPETRIQKWLERKIDDYDRSLEAWYSTIDKDKDNLESAFDILIRVRQYKVHKHNAEHMLTSLNAILDVEKNTEERLNRIINITSSHAYSALRQVDSFRHMQFNWYIDSLADCEFWSEFGTYLKSVKKRYKKENNSKSLYDLTGITMTLDDFLNTIRAFERGNNDIIYTARIDGVTFKSDDTMKLRIKFEKAGLKIIN